MLKPITINFHSRTLRSIILLSCLLVLFGLVLPMATLAAPPLPVGAEKCAGCHTEETAAWLDSPHAKAANNDLPGATCEACHGSYVEGHAREGIMQLTVDSSGCADCHVKTFGQWIGTTHAQAGVQCIGCHLSHSQELRLTDERLCASCHRNRTEDFFHTAHYAAKVTCTNCHLASPTSQEIATVSTSTEASATLGVPAPSHDFTAISSQVCITCHKQDVYATSDNVTREQLLALVNQVPTLSAQLDRARQTNKSLQTMTFASLGLGIAVGGMLGIIFTLIVGYVSQRRVK
jgi:hypothetical protein